MFNNFAPAFLNFSHETFYFLLWVAISDIFPSLSSFVGAILSIFFKHSSFLRFTLFRFLVVKSIFIFISSFPELQNEKKIRNLDKQDIASFFHVLYILLLTFIGRFFKVFFSPCFPSFSLLEIIQSVVSIFLSLPRPTIVKT